MQGEPHGLPVCPSTNPAHPGGGTEQQRSTLRNFSTGACCCCTMSSAALGAAEEAEVVAKVRRGECVRAARPATNEATAVGLVPEKLRRNASAASSRSTAETDGDGQRAAGGRRLAAAGRRSPQGRSSSDRGRSRGLLTTQRLRTLPAAGSRVGRAPMGSALLPAGADVPQVQRTRALANSLAEPAAKGARKLAERRAPRRSM